MSYKERAMPCSRTKSRPDNAYTQPGRENGRAGRRFLSLFLLAIAAQPSQGQILTLKICYS